MPRIGDCDVMVADMPAPDFDEARLTDIETILSPQKVAELLEFYLSSGDGRIAQIRHHADNGNWEIVAREAHVLIGTAGNCGAARTSELAGRLAQACREGPEAGVADLARELCLAYAAAAAAIRRWLDRPMAPVSPPPSEDETTWRPPQF
jgi:HPt (histidine-containing phosphotransfer) domain-containing protein